MMKYRVKIVGPYLGLLILISVLLLVPFATSFLYGKLWFILFSVFLFLLVETLMISSLFGYARLEETTLYIRFGFFVHKKISYHRIKSMEKKKGYFRESLFSLNTSMEYIRIEYDENKFITVSIRNSEEFICNLKSKIENKVEE